MATEPEAIAAALATRLQAPARVLLETGGLTPWLWHELSARGLVVHCIDARRAKAQLALRPAKTDCNDAGGLAEIARRGWYANIRVKSLDHHAVRAKLAARARLVAMARDLGNQLRGFARKEPCPAGTRATTPAPCPIKEPFSPDTFSPLNSGAATAGR